MKNFFSITFQTKLTKSEILEIVKDKIPNFKWRGGDSDAQGAYISWQNPESTDVKLWLGEFPFGATVSFPSAWNDAPENENSKVEFISSFKKNPSRFFSRWLTFLFDRTIFKNISHCIFASSIAK